MNAKQLKNSILQLAIQGKLVPQDPSDEPASVLLSRIRREKEALVKQGKLKKKDLDIAPITDDEKPFDIPESWEWCRLKTIFIMQAGKNIKAQELSDLQDANHIYACYGGNGIRGFIAKKSHIGKHCIIGRQGALCGNVNIASGEFYATEHAVVVEHWDNINVDWSFYFLTALNLNKYSTATAQPGLSVGNILETLIPLPPLPEQHRIVEKIEELMPLVEKYGKAQEQLDKLNTTLPDALKKSILQQAIQGRLVPQDPSDEPASVLLSRIRHEKEALVKQGKLKKKDLYTTPITEDEKPFDIPDTWQWCRLGDIGSWGAGATPMKGKPEYYAKGTIPWLRTGELNNGHVSDSEIKITQKALEDCSLRICSKGDVLIAMYGATIGKVAIADIKLTTNQACCACTPIIIYNEYLKWYLLANKQTFIEMGEGGAQPNISREKILPFPLALPPLPEQHRIVSKIEELFHTIEQVL